MEEQYLQAGVAELADAQDLGSCGATRGGSNPFARTIGIREGSAKNKKCLYCRQ